jgi:hypothetical protein
VVRNFCDYLSEQWCLFTRFKDSLLDTEGKVEKDFEVFLEMCEKEEKKNLSKIPALVNESSESVVVLCRSPPPENNDDNENNNKNNENNNENNDDDNENNDKTKLLKNNHQNDEIQ